MLHRRTITKPTTIQGVGLFTAAPASVTLLPAPANHGITFRRTDLPSAPALPAHPDSLAQGPARNTTLGRPPHLVATVEHLLAALAALGITDLEAHVQGPELPIGDGSSRLWFNPLRERLVDLPAPLHPITLDAPITVADPRDPRAAITASPILDPSHRPAFLYRLDYGPDSSIPVQDASLDASPTGRLDHDAFDARIADARTFCTAREAQAFRAAGLFTNLSPRDMLVLDDAPGAAGAPIDNTLRAPNEPARHKLLDLVGDLWLLGRPLLARVEARRSGHALTHELCRKILARQPA